MYTATLQLTRISNPYYVFQNGSTVIPFDTVNIFSVAVNSPNTVKTSGWGASFEYQLRNNYFVSANIYGDYIVMFRLVLKLITIHLN